MQWGHIMHSHLVFDLPASYVNHCFLYLIHDITCRIVDTSMMCSWALFYALSQPGELLNLLIYFNMSFIDKMFWFSFLRSDKFTGSYWVKNEEIASTNWIKMVMRLTRNSFHTSCLILHKLGSIFIYSMNITDADMYKWSFLPFKLKIRNPTQRLIFKVVWFVIWIYKRWSGLSAPN